MSEDYEQITVELTNIVYDCHIGVQVKLLDAHEVREGDIDEDTYGYWDSEDRLVRFSFVSALRWAAIEPLLPEDGRYRRMVRMAVGSFERSENAQDEPSGDERTDRRVISYERLNDYVTKKVAYYTRIFRESAAAQREKQ